MVCHVANPCLQSTDWTRVGGGRAIIDLLARDAELPDGLFAMNDSLALGALVALTEYGVQVPADLAVIGFDNIDEAGHSTPPLSSIAPSVGELARIGIDLLTRRLALPTRQSQHVTSRFQLHERASTTG
jgi:DNA-binding LacI/PurR family transcriptional regulator